MGKINFMIIKNKMIYFLIFNKNINKTYFYKYFFFLF